MRKQEGDLPDFDKDHVVEAAVFFFICSFSLVEYSYCRYRN